MPTEPTVDSIQVRMYRHGFGDCFLLSFLRGEQRVFTVLIDCGIKHNTRSEEAPIEAVIEDLRKTLTPEGKTKPRLDVLVATHEHWDHIAFFHPRSSRDFFDDFEIGQVWLSWTEDPQDEEAVEINSRLRNGVAALQIAAAGLKEAEKSQAAQFQHLHVGRTVAQAREAFNRSMDDVLGFYGVAAKDNVSKSGIKYKKGKISVETEQAMNHVVRLGEDGGGVRYLSPGTRVDARSLPAGVAAYVLGPPRGKLINKSNPSSGHSHETYFGLDLGLNGFVDGLLQRAAADQSGNDAAPRDSSNPFDRESEIAPRDARQQAWFQSSYYDSKEEYRQIEDCWLDAAGPFALQLDGAINNTSLVLAFELANSGKVLLFPGDAQVGSWLSWHDHQWKVKRGSHTETIVAEDLLKNTVLYKVSHHGSHNATIRDKGLEMMTHPELVAMIPEKEGSYSGILYQPLMKRLDTLCKGRVIVSADVDHPPETLKKKRPQGLTTAEWNAFKRDLKIEPLYVEYTVR